MLRVWIFQVGSKFKLNLPKQLKNPYLYIYIHILNFNIL